MQELNFKTLNLSKENMKFSAAHFLIFDENRAERLHGHNYRVRAKIRIPWMTFVDQGYGVDFTVLKEIIKVQLDLWDEHVLLPAQQHEMKINIQGASLDLQFRERRYVFPQNEVVLLPITNTSVELLSDLLCRTLWEKMQPLGITGLKIEIEETLGQSAESTLGYWAE